MARNYVNNKDFYESIIKYKKELIEKPEKKVPDYIGICINQICNRLSSKPNFSGYTFRDEMISDALENCFYALPKFNPERTNNPFAYFTQVAKNAFIRRITIEKKEQYTKYKNLQTLQLVGLSQNMYGDSDILLHDKNNDVANEIIGSFETKMKSKKKIKTGIDLFANVSLDNFKG
jgi:hypothetical protein